MAPPASTHADLKAWINSLDLTGKIAGTLPEKPDDGTPASEGAQSAKNHADAKKLTPGVSVEDGTDNPATGKSDKPVPNSGLLQTTVGKMPEIEKAVKTVTEETAKMAAADLDTPEGFDVALTALRKAAAELPIVFAASGLQIPNQTPAPKAAAKAAPADPVAAAKAAQDTQAAAVVDGYRKLGADRGVLVSQYLQGFYGTYQDLHKMAADGSMAAMLAQDPAAGGAPPGAGPMPGGDAGPGGPPPGAGPMPGGDAGGGQAPSIDDVAAALTEMGMSPDDLIQIAHKMQDEVQGSPAPDAGGPPVEEKAAALRVLESVIKDASDTKQHMRAGRFAFKPAGDGSADRRRRDTAKGYIRELLAASK